MLAHRFSPPMHLTPHIQSSRKNSICTISRLSIGSNVISVCSKLQSFATRPPSLLQREPPRQPPISRNTTTWYLVRAVLYITPPIGALICPCFMIATHFRTRRNNRAFCSSQGAARPPAPHKTRSGIATCHRRSKALDVLVTLPVWPMMM